MLVATAAILWGGWTLVLRPSRLSGAQCSLIVLITMSVPGLFVARRKWLRDRGATAAMLLLALADAGNIVLYFAALNRGPIAVAVLTHYLAPVLVILVAPLVTGERRSLRAIAAVPLSLFGLGLVLWRPGAPVPTTTAIMGAASALFYAVIVFSAKYAGRTYPALAVTSLHAPVSALILLAIFGRSALAPELGAPVLMVTAGGVVFGVLASVLFYKGLGRVPAQVASALTYLEPVTAAVVGAVAFGEPLGPTALAGAALVVGCGVWVVTEKPGR